MIFKNSLKLFVANFSVFWKLLLYKLIVIGICIALLVPTFGSWGEVFGRVEFWNNFTSFANNTMFAGASSLFENIFVLTDLFLQAVNMMFSYDVFAIIYSGIIVLFVLPFLFQLSSIPTGEGLYSYMASLSKSSFVGTLIAKIKKSMLYALQRTLVMLSFIAFMGVTMYYLLKLVTISAVLSMIMPAIIILYFSFMVALFSTTFCGWMPATVVFDVSPTVGLKKGLKAVKRRYFRVLSSIFMIILITTMFTLMCTTFSLIVLFPLCTVGVIMLEMVMFFESQGMRYYVDLDSIITPKKLEQCDKFSKVKDII